MCVCVVSGCVECMWGVSVCGKCAIVWRVYEFGEWVSECMCGEWLC